MDLPVRINKYLAAAGVCSRRGADELIEKGLVTVNGRTAEKGDRVGPVDVVTCEGRPVSPVHEKVLLAYNKPAGVVCSSVSQGRDEVNIIDAVGYPGRIFPIGRLDKDSRGLILLTNDGDLAQFIMKAGNFHEKEYEVTVDRAVTDDFLDRMSRGVEISFEDGTTLTTRPCQIKKLSEKSFDIILTEGKNRQIRRMCAALGYKVTDLLRTRIMDHTLGDLPEGKYTPLPC